MTSQARRRWTWWGALVVVAVAAVAYAVDLLTGWPDPVVATIVGASVTLPVAVAAPRVEGLARRADRVLATTIVVVGLVGLAIGLYVLVVVGFVGTPTGSERTVLALSMLAAALIAVFAVPARERLVRFAHRRVYGVRSAPHQALRTFSTRMTRAVPLDELLLQLAESLRRTMGVEAAEVWTGGEGVFERVVSVPDRPMVRIGLGGEPLAVASRTEVRGNAWLAMWVPELLAGREDTPVTAVPIVHLGELLGFVVTERALGAERLPSDDEQPVLVDIARQLGLALHNARLDTALQASLAELRDRNRDLVASRSRLVAASDEARRRIERDLHDGAQQYLVALTVKAGLARRLLDTDLDRAVGLVDELHGDAQTTLAELRELAYGIYPPLLRECGLAEALRTVANRSVTPVAVIATGIGRYEPGIESAVYFCCLEAIQNVGKHAGPGAAVVTEVGERDGELVFAVRDDGRGFDPATASEGHGFVNMRDRLGASGGRLEVASTPGEGTCVTGRVPLR